MTATIDKTQLQTRPESTTPAPQRPSRGFHVWLVVAAAVCAASTLGLIAAYLPMDPGESRLGTRNSLHFWLLLGHLFTASVALMLGAVQFWPGLRRRFPKAHRVMGRLYFFAGVFPSAIFGLPVAMLAVIGLPSSVPLSILAVLWFVSGVHAVKAARERRFADHRDWVIRNFALTTTAITGRLVFIPLEIFLRPQDAIAFELYNHDVTSLLNWGAFSMHLLVAEWYIHRSRRKALLQVG